MMKEFIEYIAKCIVDEPSLVEVHEKSAEEKKIVLSLKVGQNDIGKVIGREGRMAQAMRTLLAAVAAKEGKRVILEIDDRPGQQ
ncbi:MAG: KH domain-containing protein [Ignavibacteriales bacterium]|nr:KH domain-containing protein [Ignavibacteriales bacterium]MBI5728033.1 KH domain-containing protein [Ignavibacteriales bacterium]